MGNRHRGDVDFRIDGRRYTLRLTLGALARLEGAYAAADLAALGRRLAGGALAAGDVLRLLAAGLEGGGAREPERLAAGLPASDLPLAAEAVGEMLSLAFGEEEPVRPPRPQAA
jgi:hypothetical protein